MTIDQFRSHDALPTLWARELDSNATLRAVMEVMEEAHPAHFAITGDNNADVSATRAAIELGFTRGYSKYAKTLQLLAKPKLKALPLGETVYAQEEHEEESQT